VHGSQDDEGDESVNRLVSHIHNAHSPASKGVSVSPGEGVAHAEAEAGAEAEENASPGPEAAADTDENDDTGKGGKPSKKRVRQPAAPKPAAAKKPAVKRAMSKKAAAAKAAEELERELDMAVAEAVVADVEEAAASSDAGAEAADEEPSPVDQSSDVEEEVKAEAVPAPRKRKASTKKSEAEAAASMEVDADIAAEDATEGATETPKASLSTPTSKPSSHKKARKEAVVAMPLEELPEEIQNKIQMCKIKMERAVEDLLQEESSGELFDNDAEVDAAAAELLDMIRSADAYAAAAAAAAETAAVVPAPAADEEVKSVPEEEEVVDADAAPVSADAVGTHTTPANTEKKAGVAKEELVVYEEKEFRLEMAIKKIIARTMVGSSDPVSRLSVTVSARLGRSVEIMEGAFAAAAEEPLSELAESYRTTASMALNALLNDATILEDEIKSMGCRECYGIKDKSAALFEDTSPQALWRWDVVTDTARFFSKPSLANLKEAKSSCRRHGAVLRANAKLIEELSKSAAVAAADSEAKVVKLEEAAAKAGIDVAKAKEKRIAEELKKKVSSAEKAKKDEEKELKKKAAEAEKEEKKKVLEAEKEEKKRAKEVETLKKKEEAAKAKLEAQAEKERLAAEKQSEKDRLKAEEEAKLSKQKNLMLNMFGGSAVSKSTAKPSTPGAASTSTSKTLVASAEKVVDLTATNSDAAAAVMPDAGSEVVAEREQKVEFDTNAFLASMNAGMTMQDCIVQNAARIAVETPADFLKTAELRQPTKLSVMLAAASTGFGQEGYSEMGEVMVDAFMRTFSFADDQKRPAYFGTRSKSSSIISGRRPFEQDHNAVNYDYDSEDDYDEEADGEDIGDSENEEEEGGNDLEYDEFFRQDNDFGSDADSDGELMAAVAMKSRQGEEKIGLRFLRDENGQWQQRSLGDGSSSSSSGAQSFGMKAVIDDQAVGQPAIMTACYETEKDVVRLRNYGCVVFASARSMPYLGWSESQPKKSSKTEAADLAKEEADMLKAAEKAAKQAEKAAKVAEKAAKAVEKESIARKEPKAKKEPKPEVPKHMDETLLPALVKLVHGRREGIEKLVTDFIADHPTEIKAKVERKLREIADKTKSDEGHGNARWVVKQSVIESLGLTVGTAVEGNDAVFDLATVCYTPPKIKRARPAKEEAPATARAHKSARLRGDVTECVKELGHEWWPEGEKREKGDAAVAADPAASSPAKQDGAEMNVEAVEADEAQGMVSPVEAAAEAASEFDKE